MDYFTAEWEALREKALTRAGDRCSHPGCGLGGRLYVTLIDPERDGGKPELDNVRVLCAQHHGRLTGRGGRRNPAVGVPSREW